MRSPQTGRMIRRSYASRCDPARRWGSSHGPAHKSTDRALSERGRALDDAERLVRFDPQSVDSRSDLAWCLHDLGIVLLDNHLNDQAVAANRRAIEINRKLAEEQPAASRRRAALAETLNNLGLVTVAEHPDSAEAAYNEAARLLDIPSQDQPDRRCVSSLGSILNNWGNLAKQRGQTELAFQRFARGLAPVPTNDYQRGIALDQEMTSTPAAYNPMAGRELYNFACIFGLAAAAARDDQHLAPSTRQRLADVYALSALDSLKCAAGKGFFDDPKLREQVRHDPDLALLRGLSEFTKLVLDARFGTSSPDSRLGGEPGVSRPDPSGASGEMPR